MVTLSTRVAQFESDREAPGDIALEALCRDHVGTYVLPFPCIFAGGEWRNQSTEAPLDCEVIGWREWKPIQRFRR